MTFPSLLPLALTSFSNAHCPLSFLKHFSLGFWDSVVFLEVPAPLLPPLRPPNIGESLMHCFYPLQARLPVNSRPAYSPAQGSSLLHCLPGTLNPKSKAEPCLLLPPQMVIPPSSPSKPQAPNHSDSQSSLSSPLPGHIHGHIVPHLEDPMSLPTGLSAPALAPPWYILHSKLEGLLKANSTSYFCLVSFSLKTSQGPEDKNRPLPHGLQSPQGL